MPSTRCGEKGLSATDQAASRYIAERQMTLPDALWEFIPPWSYADWAGLKYVLLYLEWEAQYPDEWMASAKSWGTKHGLLHDLARAVPSLATEVIDQLVDLIGLAVRREHRCEDVGYAVLARAVGGSRLRRLLLELSDDPDEGFRSRARYLLWLLDHPEAPKPKVGQWKAWLRSQKAEPNLAPEPYGRGQEAAVVKAGPLSTHVGRRPGACESACRNRWAVRRACRHGDQRAPAAHVAPRRRPGG